MFSRYILGLGLCSILSYVSAATTSGHQIKKCQSSICRDNAAYDLLKLQTTATNFTTAVSYISDVKSTLQNKDAEMTIFVPVDKIEEEEVLELFNKASNVSASPEDREKFANLLKGHIIIGSAVHLRNNPFGIDNGENECECEGCHEHDPKEQRSDDEVLFKNLKNVIKSNAEKIKKQLGIEGTSDESESRTAENCQCRCKAYNFDTLTLSEADGDIVVKNEKGKTARVLIDNILASNAVIHLIDRVLF